MKSMDADIKYCKTRKRFYYKTEKVFASGFVDKSKIKGEQNYMRIFLKIISLSDFIGQGQCKFVSAKVKINLIDVVEML
ncbi:MAG: hypothetical protein U0V54_00060 [Saprospiraceae bacterium]